jgi:hypothetical protein
MVKIKIIKLCMLFQLGSCRRPSSCHCFDKSMLMLASVIVLTFLLLAASLHLLIPYRLRVPSSASVLNITPCNCRCNCSVTAGVTD